MVSKVSNKCTQTWTPKFDAGKDAKKYAKRTPKWFQNESLDPQNELPEDPFLTDFGIVFWKDFALAKGKY